MLCLFYRLEGLIIQGFSGWCECEQLMKKIRGLKQKHVPVEKHEKYAVSYLHHVFIYLCSKDGEGLNCPVEVDMRLFCSETYKRAAKANEQV